jgi:hypothetical protein
MLIDRWISDADLMRFVTSSPFGPTVLPRFVSVLSDV